MAGLIIKPRARIFHGHHWVYASEVRNSFGDPKPGEVIYLKDFRDRPLGSATYNPNSQIVARRFSFRRQDLDLDFFLRRISRAVKYREQLAIDPELSRLVWGEADGLPGLVVDRYGEHLVVQALTLAMRQRIDDIRSALLQILSPQSILLRNDASALKAEGLPMEILSLHGKTPDAFPLSCDGLEYQIRLHDGQRLGLYPDQLENHAQIAKLAEGKQVLSCFANQGGFALACAGAQKVTAVEASGAACDALRKNAEINHLEIEVVEQDVFDFLKNTTTDYDLIILDPPDFIQSHKALKSALREYKEIHLRSLQQLSPGGILSSFCCSPHVTRELFLQNLVDASVDAKKSIRHLQEHKQRADHPILPALPETEYLIGFTVEVIASV